MGQDISLKSKRKNPWFKSWFNFLHTQSIVCATVKGQCLESLGCVTLPWSLKFRRPCYIHNSWRVIYHSTTHSFNLQEVRPSARLGGITLKFASNYTSFVFSSKKVSMKSSSCQKVVAVKKFILTQKFTTYQLFFIVHLSCHTNFNFTLIRIH